MVRWRFIDFQSDDYRAFLDRWYAYLAENGGFAALKDGSFSNYNTPYLALLALITYLPVPQIVAIKAISAIFDVALAGFAYKIIAATPSGSAMAADSPVRHGDPAADGGHDQQYLGPG